jgi:hypothetical protein
MSGTRISGVECATVKNPAMPAAFARGACERVPCPQSRAIRARLAATV